MIVVEFTADEAIALLVAGRAMVLAYMRENKLDEEAYLRLAVACEKIDLQLWGKATVVEQL